MRISDRIWSVCRLSFVFKVLTFKNHKPYFNQNWYKASMGVPRFKFVQIRTTPFQKEMIKSSKIRAAGCLEEPLDHIPCIEVISCTEDWSQGGTTMEVK